MNRKMQALLLAAAAVAGGHSSARAQGVPVGYCQLTSLGTAVALTACSGGIPSGANVAVFRAEAQALRFRDDAVDPTASVGMPLLVADPPLLYAGTLSKVRVIEQTSGGKLDVLFYKRASQ